MTLMKIKERDGCQTKFTFIMIPPTSGFDRPSRPDGDLAFATNARRNAHMVEIYFFFPALINLRLLCRGNQTKSGFSANTNFAS